MPKYSILINTSNNEITSAYSPDFDAQLLDDERFLSDELELKSHITNKLTELSYSNPLFIKPKTFDQLKQFRLIEPQQSWQEFEIPDIYGGRFAKCFPIIGNAANLSTILTNAFIMFMATRISIKDDENTKSIIAACVGMFLSLVTYNYSEASQSLRYAGHNMDLLVENILRCKCSMPKLNKIKCQNTLKPTITIFIITIIIVNSIIAANAFYQQSQLLKDEFLNIDQNKPADVKQLQSNLISWLVIDNLIVSSIVSGLAFQIGFINEFINDATHRIIRQMDSSRTVCFRYDSLRAADHEIVPLTDRVNEIYNPIGVLTSQQMQPASV